ncbi:MAG: Nuclease [Ferruginibacter sp.]|nr:Nuclease [Ferruginibacter sp.]
MMKKTFLRAALALLIFAGSAGVLFAWGSWGHQHINNSAIFALPEEMRVFFYNHKDFITEESVVPDLRKYTINDKAEFNRHYIDLEDFSGEIPRTSKEAMAKYDEKTLQKNGILPWYMQDMMEKLTKAMKDKRKTEILFIASDLGHYIGDANMPLHTSSNHDGQKSDQRGIHAFWESQLPEYFGEGYNFKVSDAVFIPDVVAETWNIVNHSHSLIDTLLVVEKRLKASYPADKVYKADDKGVVIKNKFGQMTHTREYAQAYHTALNGMVQNQMRHAIQDLANFWYTAWVNAGKPNLNELDPAELTSRNRKSYKKDLKLSRKGKLFGFRPEDEFN